MVSVKAYVDVAHRVILFGAGASHGSGVSKPPPLADGLLDNLRARCPSWSRIPSEFAPGFNEGFELGMQQLMERQSRDIPRLMREMAIYFAEFSCEYPNDVYSRLVSRLRRVGKLASTQFSTLNYECLLEQAINWNELLVDYLLADPLTGLPRSRTNTVVWKLHGSANFIPDFLGSEMRNISVRITPTASMAEAPIRAVAPQAVRPWCEEQEQRNLPFFPALATFNQAKHVYISPDFIAAAQSEWKDAVHRADTVAVVGVRPNPADKHIWGPLKKTAARLVAVGSENDFRAWARHREGPFEYLGARFQDEWRRLADTL